MSIYQDPTLERTRLCRKACEGIPDAELEGLDVAGLLDYLKREAEQPEQTTESRMHVGSELETLAVRALHQLESRGEARHICYLIEACAASLERMATR